MKNYLLSFCLSLPFVAFAQADARLEYIKKHKEFAIEEMERAGVPASIKLGQAILESNAGQSTLAIQANNHFGIKCGNDWDGKSYYKEDDDRDGNGNIVKSCFRKYKDAEDCYEDHSDFLRDPKKYNRYGFLFRLDQRDYKSWAYGLQSAGYATSDTYAESLIRVIEAYKLYEFDEMSGGEVPPPISNRRSVGRVNDVKVVLAKEGETIEDIARIYRLATEKIIEYNDRGYLRSDKLKQNTRVFIQKKQKRWHGRAKFHFVRDNQTMFDISQQYGIRLEKLLSGNKMDAGEEPANGEQVRLRGFFWKKGPKPRLRPANDPSKPTSPNGTDPRPSTTTPANDNGKLTPDGEELFEIGEGEVKNDKDRTGQSTGNKPATTGTPYPSDPSSTGTKPTDTNVKPYIPLPVTRPNPPAKPAGQGVYHTIVKGDTLYSVSKKYGTTVARIKELNNMTDDNIKIGQSLRVQ